jgi:hypothetical protein
MGRETANYERQLNTVKTHMHWGSLGRANTAPGSAVHIFKKRAQAEVALAEGMLTTYAISQAIGDDSNMLVGLFENYNEHFHIDIAGNPQLVGADLDVPGQASSQLINSNVSNPSHASNVNNRGIQQQEEERRRVEDEKKRAEEERVRKSREAEAERERVKRVKERLLKRLKLHG